MLFVQSKCLVEHSCCVIVGEQKINKNRNAFSNVLTSVTLEHFQLRGDVSPTSEF